MDLPLVIFYSLFSLLALCGASGLFVFQRGKRRQWEKSGSPKAPVESEPPLPSDLDLQANALAGLMAAVPPLPPSGTISLFRVRLGTLPQTAPRSAVMKAWRELENSTLQILSLFDYGEFPVTRLKSLEMMALLKDNGALEEEHFEICQSLDDIRNAVFGLTNARVGAEVALTVIEAVDLLIARLIDFRGHLTETSRL